MRGLEGRPEPDAFREARVEAAKREISEGRFRIDAQAIADRMLEAAKALVRDRPKERGTHTFKNP